MEAFRKYYLDILTKKYAKFSGRASKKEFWTFFGFNLAISVLLLLLSSVARPLIILYNLYGLLVLVPSIALGVRRLHDIGKSGWWILVSLIPLIGIIWLIILYLKEGDPEENQYGPPPED